jgi:hypothetical protein
VFAGALAGRIGLVPPEPITFSTLLGMIVIVAGVALAIGSPTVPPRRPPGPASPPPEECLVDPIPSEV